MWRRRTFREFLFDLSVHRNGDGGGGGGGGGGSEEKFSPEYVKELRAENNGHRLKSVQLQQEIDNLKAGQEKAIKDAIAAEVARLTTEHTAALEKQRTESTTAFNDRFKVLKLEALAAQAGVVDMDALKLLDLTKVTLKEDGSIDGAEALFDDAKKAKPWIFGAAKSTTGGNNAPKPGTSEPKDARTLSAQDYKAEKARLLSGQT